MNDLTLIASATGLGLLAGIRLYATVLTLSLAIKLGWLELGDRFADLEVLGNWWVMGIAATAFTAEFFADKIPWVDSLWDSVHTFIRPLGAALLAFTAIGDLDRTVQVSVALLAGGVAFAGHSTKAATRMLVNSSPEPVSNIALSLAGDAAVPLGVWFVLNYPLVAGAAVAVFLLLFFVVSPGIYRLVRVQWRALRSLVRHWMGGAEGDELAMTRDSSDSTSDAAAALEARLAVFMAPLPEPYCGIVCGKLSLDNPPLAIEAVASRGLSGLNNSIGYICFAQDELIFVTRRWFRHRVHSVPLSGRRTVRFRSGLLLDALELDTGGETQRFHIFREHWRRGESLADVLSSATAEA